MRGVVRVYLGYDDIGRLVCGQANISLVVDAKLQTDLVVTRLVALNKKYQYFSFLRDV